MNNLDIPITGLLDEHTLGALQQTDPAFNLEGGLDVNMYLALYQSIPVSSESLARRRLFDRHLAALLASVQRRALEYDAAGGR